MSRVDEELAQAVAESEAVARAEEPQPVTTAVPARPGNTKRNLGLLAALLVMGGGILTLVFASFNQAAVYARGVDDLMREKAKLVGRNVRVQGTLVSGTLRRRDQPCEFRFSIEKNGTTVPIRYPQCIIPDTFRDLPGTEVTAEGSLAASGDFEATQIIAKCPSKYDMQQRAQRGEAMPHSMGGKVLSTN